MYIHPHSKRLRSQRFPDFYPQVTRPKQQKDAISASDMFPSQYAPERSWYNFWEKTPLASHAGRNATVCQGQAARKLNTLKGICCVDVVAVVPAATTEMNFSNNFLF